MKRLYSAQVARPLSSAGGRPTRLGFSTTAWAPGEDLIAVISGCGAVAVFHADAPGEVALLVGTKRAPARHLAWRNAPNKPSMLAVADAAGRLTFWVAKDRRVNVWAAAASVELPSVAVAIGWTKNSAAIAAVLAHGAVAVWAVPDIPVQRDALQQRQRQARQAIAQQQQQQAAAYPRGSREAVAAASAQQQAQSRRAAQALHEFNLKYLNNIVRDIPPKDPEQARNLGGQIRCAAVAPGGVDQNSVAIVTVSAAAPLKLSVWSVSVVQTGRQSNTNFAFEIRPLSATEMDLADDGKCVAVATVPKHGMLFAVGDRGVLVKWYLKNQRPTGDSGWQPRGKTKLEKEITLAVEKGILPPQQMNTAKTKANANSTTRALQICRRRKVYAFDVSSDCKTIVTSSASGLLVWDAENLQVKAGYTLAEKKLETGDVSPYWGLCISPGSAAVIALNGEGRVDARSLLTSMSTAVPEALPDLAKDAAGRLVAATSADGLRGGWDVIASVAIEGPASAALVAKALSQAPLTGEQNDPITTERRNNLHSLMKGIANGEDYATSAAKRLLEVAIDAIRQSAPDNIKLKLMTSEKEAKQYTSPEAVRKHLQQYCTSVRVSTQQLAAAPLADWIMVMCSLWLTKCARTIAREDEKGQLGAWAVLCDNDPQAKSAPNLNLQPQGMVNDADLMRTLRRACLPAAILLALEDEQGEPEADPRYYRFHYSQSSELVAALWDVSSAWDVVEGTNRTITQPSIATSLTPFPKRSKEGVTATISALTRHPEAANIIAASEKLRVCAAERALGLHGSAIGAGFIISCTRDNRDSSSCTRAASGSQRGDEGTKSSTYNEVNSGSQWGDYGTKSEWCPFDLVTGRPLPPWAPLRRCIVSGLLAAETTQHKSDSHSVNAAAPWISKWAQTSPLGGRWARVPSLDLERYELLPAVSQTSVERVDAVGQMQGRPTKTEDALAQPGSTGGSMAPPPRHMHSHASAPMSAHGYATAAGAAAVPNGGSAVPPHMMTSVSSQAPPGMAGMAGNPMLQPGMRAPLVAATGGSRIQASPGMSTASSTTDPGSSTSKAARKRQERSSSASRARIKKRSATGDRASTASQLSDLAGPLAMPGLPTTSSPVAMNGLTRNNSMADAMSTDTRSTVTAATNATGGQQDTSKPKRPRKRAKAQQQQPQHTAAAVANRAAAAAAAAAAGTGIPGVVGSAATPPVVPTPGQASGGPQAHQMSRQEVIKRQQQVQNQRRKEKVAAAAAAAAAAASAHTDKPQGRNNAMLQSGIPADGMGGPSMAKGNDVMAQLGYVGNAGIPGSLALSPAQMSAMGREIPGVGNAPNMNMMGGMAGSAGVGMPLGAAGMQNHFGGRAAGDGGFNGMVNGAQNANGMALLQQLGTGTNTGGQPGLQGNALTALALNCGVTPEGLTGLTPDQLRVAFDAISKRMALNRQAGMQGSPSTTSNPNLMVSAGLNAVGHGAVGGNSPMPGVMGGNVSPVRNVLTGEGVMTSMGLPMGNPQTSAADSVSSVPARVNALGMSGAVVGGGPGTHPGEPSSAADGMPVNAPVSGASAPIAHSGGDADDRGRRVWKGDLQVRSSSTDLIVPCVAIQHTIADKAPLGDTSGWPTSLYCYPHQIKNSAELLNEVSDPLSQWCVRFVPVDENGNEVKNFSITKLVSVMVRQSLAFAIPCNEPGGTPGTLYLWGTRMQTHDLSLLGVFRPSVEMGVDQELQLMMMGAGAK